MVRRGVKVPLNWAPITPTGASLDSNPILEHFSQDQMRINLIPEI